MRPTISLAINWVKPTITVVVALLPCTSCNIDAPRGTECQWVDICPVDQQCPQPVMECVTNDQVTSCDGRTDYDGCVFWKERVEGGFTLTDGLCLNGYCVQDRCSNGILTNWELCDGDKFHGQTCESEGFVGGELSCLGCGLDMSECEPVPTCGNGTVDASEMCDGLDLAGATCGDFAGQTGALACTWNCRYDKSGCR